MDMQEEIKSVLNKNYATDWELVNSVAEDLDEAVRSGKKADRIAKIADLIITTHHAMNRKNSKRLSSELLAQHALHLIAEKNMKLHVRRTCKECRGDGSHPHPAWVAHEQLIEASAQDSRIQPGTPPNVTRTLDCLPCKGKGHTEDWVDIQELVKEEAPTAPAPTPGGTQ